MQVQHGRLRTKTEATIAKGTEGQVQGLDDRMVLVQVLASIGDKTKMVTAPFKRDVLEPVREDVL